jgi:hypothetical protein
MIVLMLIGKAKLPVNLALPPIFHPLRAKLTGNLALSG